MKLMISIQMKLLRGFADHLLITPQEVNFNTSTQISMLRNSSHHE